MTKDLHDNLVFRNSKGEEYRMTRQEFRNSAKGQQDIDHRPRFVDQSIPNLKTGLDYVEKATHKREDAMQLDRIESSGGRVKEQYDRSKKYF